MVITKSLFGEDGESVLEDGAFQLLIVANVVGVLGTALVSPLLSSLIGPFGATPSSIGLMISMFSGPGIIFIPIMGYIADRVGRKPVIMGGLLTYGIAGGAISFTTDFQIVLALRVIQGIGYSGIVPIVITTLGDIYTGTEEAAAQGLRFTSSGLSLTVIPLLAGAIVGIGWQYPFLVFFLTIPVTVLIGIYLEEPTASVSTDPGNPNRDSSEESKTDSTIRNVRFKRLLVLTSKPELVSIIILRSLAAFVLIGFFTYISIIVVGLSEGTPQQAGLAVAINSIAFATTASQVGRLSARLPDVIPLTVSTTLIGVGFSIVALSNTTRAILIGSTVLGMGLGVSLTIYRSLVTSYAPDNYRGSIVSVMEMSARFANFLTPIVMGGAIGLTTPIFGFENAVRWTSVAVAGTGTVGGFICLIIWYVFRDRASKHSREGV